MINRRNLMKLFGAAPLAAAIPAALCCPAPAYDEATTALMYDGKFAAQRLVFWRRHIHRPWPGGWAKEGEFGIQHVNKDWKNECLPGVLAIHIHVLKHVANGMYIVKPTGFDMMYFSSDVPLKVGSSGLLYTIRRNGLWENGYKQA